jgi:hypothetical protein
MKISKKRLRQIIKEERAKLSKESHLNEARTGSPSIGFANWQPNRRPNFARSYGSGARVIGQYHDNNTDLFEQPMPAPSADPVESAYQELKFSGAYKELQETLHDSYLDLEGLFDKHSDMMLQADQGSLLDDLQEVMANLDNLRNTFNALR